MSVSTRFVGFGSISVDPGVDPRDWTGCIEIDCGTWQAQLQLLMSKGYVNGSREEPTAALSLNQFVACLAVSSPNTVASISTTHSRNWGDRAAPDAPRC